MKLSVKLALLTASSGLLITSAFADGFAADPVVIPVSKNNIYVSADIGYGTLATPEQNAIEPDGYYIIGASYQTGSFAAGFNLGFNHAFNNNILLGAEFGGDYNGESTYTEDFYDSESITGTINSVDFHLLATGTYFLKNGFNVFAKAGGARVLQRLTVSDDTAENDDTTITQIKPMVAVGAGYQIKTFNIYAQYSHIFGENTSDFNELFNEDGTFTGVVAVDTFKLGIAVNFAV